MEKLEHKWCPRCNDEKLREERVRNSLSRRDNKTYICSSCGEREAFVDFFSVEKIPANQLIIERNFHKKIGKDFGDYLDWKNKVKQEMHGL